MQINRKMSTEEIALVSPQNGINSQLLFQDDPLRFNCTGTSQQQQQQRRVGDPKTRELTGFIDDNKLFSSSAGPTTTSSGTAGGGSDRYFTSHHPHHHHQDFPRNIYQRDRHGTSGDESDGEDDEDDEEDVGDDEDDVDGDHQNGVNVLVAAIDCSNNLNRGHKNSNCINDNGSDTTGNDKIGNGNAKQKHLSSFGISGEVMVGKDVVGGDGGRGMGQTANNSVTIAETDGEMYYSPYLQGTEGSGCGLKDLAVENGCGFSGRKEVSSFLSESGESLRAILSDPVTGALMDDAMILPCGHSFGAGGIQHVIRMKACYSCSQSICEGSVAPNLSLRTAVQAFRREEELQFYRSSKRRRERFDQDKGGYGDSMAMDPPRGRGVQFPFAVADRVIIKGNKRTPQRFVGREAVVTTQCLNGWYVVKTLDNAESVKLQYRSLAKVSDDQSSKAMSTKMPSNWL